jgi:hypothetical protein
VGITRTGSATGVSGASQAMGTGGIAGAIPAGSWLPTLPDGSSMGPKPAGLHDRYVDLYQKFGEAWRVNGESSLFDYAPGGEPVKLDARGRAAWKAADLPAGAHVVRASYIPREGSGLLSSTSDETHVVVGKD